MGGGKSTTDQTKLCNAADTPEGIAVQYNGKTFEGGHNPFLLIPGTLAVNNTGYHDLKIFLYES